MSAHSNLGDAPWTPASLIREHLPSCHGQCGSAAQPSQNVFDDFADCRVGGDPVDSELHRLKQIEGLQFGCRLHTRGL